MTNSSADILKLVPRYHS